VTLRAANLPGEHNEIGILIEFLAEDVEKRVLAPLLW
jgi:hypothetical protein